MYLCHRERFVHMDKKYLERKPCKPGASLFVWLSRTPPAGGFSAGAGTGSMILIAFVYRLITS